jgi:hypothetical protein
LTVFAHHSTFSQSWPGRRSHHSFPIERIASRIYLIRRLKLMFDCDVADLYAVDTRTLNLAVNLNQSRFPKDFMFRLGAEEVEHAGSGAG